MKHWMKYEHFYEIFSLRIRECYQDFFHKLGIKSIHKLIKQLFIVKTQKDNGNIKS